MSQANIDFTKKVVADLGKFLPGAFRYRPMFGGCGVYCNDLFFAITDDSKLYVKGDDESETIYKQHHSHNFVYMTKNGPASMRYWFVTPQVMSDAEKLVEFVQAGISAAGRRKTSRLRK